MNKGWDIDAILADPAKHGELITLAGQRRQASQEFYQPRLDAFIRFYKIYSALKDASDDDDESNTGPSYAFGIIEDATAALSESMLNSKIPTPARPRHIQDEEKAEKFNAMVGTYFASGQYQSDYPQSVRERMICGPSWEFDGWACQYRSGKRWQKQKQITPEGNEVELTVEAPIEEPIKVGYYTRFPSVFLMRPQPRVDSVEAMKWLIEIEERRALEDLREQQFVDPKTQQKMPFFRLEKIDEEKKGGKIIRPAQLDQKGNDYMAQLREIQDGIGQRDENVDQGSIDELTLEWIWEPDRVFVIANGLWVVAYIENLLHRPGIPYRIKNCTPQKHSLYGKGMIEPVEFLLYELDDIHVLSMRQWMRAIHKMIAYNPEAVPYAANDFKRRADGKIRVTPPLGGSVGSQIQVIPTENVGREMLQAESNDKGLIERALGMPDFSQGVEGTKQDHDTLGGLQEIKQQAAKRVASIRRQELAGYQKQMWRMEGMFGQFLLVKTPFYYHGVDGSTAMLELDLWDIDTQGRGFDFPIIYDPAFGDDALMRNQKMVLQDTAFKYNDHVMTHFPPGTKPLAQVDVIFADLCKAFGYMDTANILKKPDGTMTPEEKLQAMLRGDPVQISPNEDLVACYAYLVAQMSNPKLAVASQTGQAPPDILLRIQAHVKMLQGAIGQALRDPSVIIRAKQFAQPGGQGVPGAAPTGDSPGRGVANMGPKSPRGRA